MTLHIPPASMPPEDPIGLVRVLVIMGLLLCMAVDAVIIVAVSR